MENPFENNQPKRSSFLTVLCILTFIGSGWVILSSLFGLLTGGLQDSVMQMQQTYQGSGSAGMEFMKSYMNSSAELLQVTAQYGKAIKLLTLLLAVFSLIGAAFMYKLKRVGFYIYVVAQVLALFILPYFAGFSFIVLISFFTSAFFTALFIILYAVNFKQLK